MFLLLDVDKRGDSIDNYEFNNIIGYDDVKE
jgi:hypothetical protein